MKWRRSVRILAGCALAAGFSLIGLRAEVSGWLKYLEAGSIQDAFFRMATWPGGSVRVRKPPRETRSALGGLIAAAPGNADLYRLRACEEELQADFAAAEADWLKYVETAQYKADAQLVLAEYYHRRLRPEQELTALRAAAQAGARPSERLTPEADQISWRTFKRMLELIRLQQLPADSLRQTYADWMARYPRQPEPYKGFFDYLRQQKQFEAAERQIGAYQQAFPEDRVYPLTARASLEAERGNVSQALALYEREFDPLWPDALMASFFDALQKAGRLRSYLAETRLGVQRNPADLRAVAKLFFCLRKLGNEAAARRALVEFRLRKETGNAAWRADELAVLATLFMKVQDANEAVRHYYALYSLPGAPADSREKALVGIADVLLSSPGEAIRFGSGDLSLYRDIATMDPYPGYLNGILSLLLNSESPRTRMAEQEQVATAYYHRARAADLVGLLDKQFPQSAARAGLHARLIEAYAVYGDSDGVIRHGREYLSAFPAAPQRAAVALAMADAYARKSQPNDEFALYDSLLKELAGKADGIPLGARAADAPVPPRAQEAEDEPESGNRPAGAVNARSPEYARVLDRYISRLVAMDRVMDALAVCRGEIDRNPDDPGLYERLAAFLDQNRLSEQVESVYRRAIDRFPDASWTHKLARWYLRRQRRAEFEKLTGDVVKIFSGTDLESYFRELVNASALGPAAYQQVNLFAHQRFPNNLQFVRNLLNAYSRVETRDSRAYRELLRQYWFYDDQLRSQFLASNGQEEQREAQALKAQAGDAAKLAASDPGAARLAAEAAAWNSHFEEAAPYFDALAKEYPGDQGIVLRAAAIHRSLAAFKPEYGNRASALAESAANCEPRSHAALTQAGEIHADHDQFGNAKPLWDRIAQIEPGSADGYLETATIFWDYFQYADALRTIEEGRRKLTNPSLHAYEAGAIHENKGELANAVEEYVNGVVGHGGDGQAPSPARSRLLQLARRTALRAEIESRTSGLIAGANPSRAAVSLRLAILEAQNRRADMEASLGALARSATSAELLDDVGAAATRFGFDAVKERVQERQIALSTDDIERARLRLAQARYFEAKPDIVSARRIYEDVLRANPAVLGVVRAATDFYWRNHLSAEAVQVLTEAAAIANPSFRRQFTFEAATKATEAGMYTRARDLLTELLRSDPLNADYLAANAETYSRAGQYQQLRDFYTAKIAEISRMAPAADRAGRVAALRRGLVPALERMGDHAAAIDQYIEIVNQYPEDEALLREAALYAIRHNLQARITDYYTKFAASSPKDVRPQIVQARLQTQFEDYSAAISAYDRAIAIRPDRLDLRTAQAQLLERLTRFDQAIEVYRNLYTLSYHDPQWQLKIAEMMARERRGPEAVQAVERALIEGRPERASTFFNAAAELEKWGLLQDAARYAVRGVDAAGPRLLIDEASGAQLYARVMTRSRRQEEAFARLLAAWRAGSQSPQREAVPVLGGAALREIGATARQYFTPEEKASLVAFLENARTAQGAPSNWSNILLDLAQAAGVQELEVRWRSELLLAHPDAPESAALLSRITEMQKSRMQYAALGDLLERYWLARSDGLNHLDLLARAAQAYAVAGNTAGELRVLSRNPGLVELPRYLELLKRSPNRRLEIAAASNAGLQAAINSGEAEFARKALLEAAGRMKPVWMRAYVGVTGLYYRDDAPEVNQAFTDLLGGGTIRERLGKPVDRNQQLAGDQWFYFGSRYGEYLALMNKAGSEDYLPAQLEAAPARASGYFALAQSYEELGKLDRALEEYEAGVQLSADAGKAYDSMAEILWREDRRDEAVERWKEALEAFLRQVNSGRVPPEFWRNAEDALTAIGKHGVLAAVRTQADQFLRAYIRINGSYEAAPLLRGALAASGSPDAGVAWILELSQAARTPAETAGFLSQIVDSVIPEAEREPVLRRVVEIQTAVVQGTAGEARVYAQSTLEQRRASLAEYLIEHRRTERARAALANIADPPPRLTLLLAAQTGELSRLIDRYRQDPAHAPASFLLQNAAADLNTLGDHTAARTILEYLYTRELDARGMDVSNFLGLAGLRLETGDVTGAVSLLRRMVLVCPEPFENLKAAADLLERTGHQTEATEFLTARQRAVPWDDDARVRLASIRRDGSSLAATVSSAAAPYETRVRAALAIAASGAVLPSGSGELAVLARGRIEPAAAEVAFYHEARLRAATAAGAPDVRLRLLLGALAVNPETQNVRIALVRAALDARQYQIALAAAAPFVPGWWPENEENSEWSRDWARRTGSEFLAAGNASRAERLALAQGLADAAYQSGDLNLARRFLLIANAVDSSPQLQARLAAVKAEVERRAADAKRRPVVTANLEQPEIVRPRLISSN